MLINLSKMTKTLKDLKTNAIQILNEQDDFIDDEESVQMAGQSSVDMRQSINSNLEAKKFNMTLLRVDDMRKIIIDQNINS